MQVLQGCFEPAPGEFAEYAGFRFNRCPVTYQSVRSAALANEGTDGMLKQLGRELYKLPAKRVAALVYVENFLLKLAASREKRGSVE